MSDLRPLDELRESLRLAGEREMQPQPRPTRRRRLARRWRPLLAATVVVAGAGGVAVASDLISIGSPQRDAVGRDTTVRPAGRLTVDVTAADKPLPWGVAAYEAPNGQSCAVAGQNRVGTLGLVRDGAFRPYEASTGGPCVDLAKRNWGFDVRQFSERTLVYGNARPRVARVAITERDGTRSTAAVGAAGAFLFVFDGTLGPADFTIEAVDRRGRVVDP